MKAEKSKTRSPGKVLLEDFLIPNDITPYRLAKETGMDQTRVSEIIRGLRGISLDSALRLARYFGNTPEYWINLQAKYALKRKKKEMQGVLSKIKPYRNAEN